MVGCMGLAGTRDPPSSFRYAAFVVALENFNLEIETRSIRSLLDSLEANSYYR